MGCAVPSRHFSFFSFLPATVAQVQLFYASVEFPFFFERLSTGLFMLKRRIIEMSSGCRRCVSVLRVMTLFTTVLRYLRTCMHFILKC